MLKILNEVGGRLNTDSDSRGDCEKTELDLRKDKYHFGSPLKLEGHSEKQPNNEP